MSNEVFFLDMTLVTNDQDKPQGRENSVIWQRNTRSIFSNDTYPFTQVIDREGNPIEPAYSEWIEWEATRQDFNGDKIPFLQTFASLENWNGKQ